MKATYGVMGMMEWHALIPMRHNLLRVRFSGGSLSGYGVTPATFTTDNPVVMHLIEESHYFRSGKIRRIRKDEEDQQKMEADNKDLSDRGEDSKDKDKNIDEREDKDPVNGNRKVVFSRPG